MRHHLARHSGLYTVYRHMPELSPPSSVKRRQAKRASVGARVLLTGFASVLVITGAFATWMLWHAYQRASEKYQWTPTPCTILKSEIREQKENLNAPTEWLPVVEYTYLIDNESYRGNKIRIVDGPSKDKAQAEEVLAKYRPGQSGTCFVNPAHPEQALLQLETKASIYTLWFPLLFVVGGIGMILHVWWPEENEVAAAAPQPATEAATSDPVEAKSD